MTLSVVYWLYEGERGYTTAHVNAQLEMLDRHLHMPFRVVCVTDQTDGLNRRIEAYPAPPLAEHLERVSNTALYGYPSCKRKLWNFSRRAQELGARIFVNDLDNVILRDITPMVDRDEDLVVWRRNGVIQGAAYLLTTGTHTHIWRTFESCPDLMAGGHGRCGDSDQGWMNYKLGAGTPDWGDQTYIPRRAGPPPESARLVSFDRPKPWTAEAREIYPWISDHYELKK